MTVRGREGVREPVEELWITGHVDDRGAAGAIPQHVAGGTVEPVPLRPGRYDVSVRGADIVGEVRTVEVRAGESTLLALDPAAGEACTFVLEAAPGATLPGIASLVVRAEDGRAVTSWGTRGPNDGPWTTAQRVPAGSFRLTVRDASLGAARGADGSRRVCGELSFTVPVGGGRWRVELK